MFQAFCGEVSEEEIWIELPEVIKRIERRKYFRLQAPLGTRINFIHNTIKHELIVLNVSEGGVLVTFERDTKRKPVFKKGEYLKQLSLAFPPKTEDQKVDIKEALVRRSERNPLKGRYRYGLQFTNIELDEKDKLRNLIHIFQRQFLRRKKMVKN